MQLVGVQEKCPTSAAEFHSIFQTSSFLRTSAPTAKNEQSSRSHAVYRIRAVNNANRDVPDGEFFLVDLAGSEGSQDSKDHCAERLAETKDINTSLSVLKDCIRGRTLWGLQQLEPTAANKRAIHIPWRSSKLTQVLKHVFATQSEQACKTLDVACVAPSIVDSAHSKNTLRYAEMLKVPVPKMKSKRDPIDPRGWSNAKTIKWIAENVRPRSPSFSEITDLYIVWDPSYRWKDTSSRPQRHGAVQNAAEGIHLLLSSNSRGRQGAGRCVL